MMVIIDIVLTFLVALLNIFIFRLYSMFREKVHIFWLNNIVSIVLAPFFFFAAIYPMLIEFWLRGFWKYNVVVGTVTAMSTYLIIGFVNRKKMERHFNRWNHGKK